MAISQPFHIFSLHIGGENSGGIRKSWNFNSMFGDYFLVRQEDS